MNYAGYGWLLGCLLGAATTAWAGGAGQPDPAFGPNADGRISITFAGGSSYAYTALTTPDGTLYLAGSARNDLAKPHIAFARIRPDGSQEQAVHTIAGFSQTLAAHVTEGSGGTLIAAGYGFAGVAPAWVICRLKADDLTLDTSFAAGAATPGCTAGDVPGFALATLIQDDGRIVVAGIDASTSPDRAVLRRYHVNGTPDTSFAGGTGIATLPNDYLAESGFFALAAAADGSLIAVGQLGTPPNRTMLIARFTPDGLLDKTFSNDGATQASFPLLPIQQRDDYANTVAILPDASILVAGPVKVLDPNFYRAGLVKLLPDGTPAAGFSSGSLPDGYVLVEPCEGLSLCSMDPVGMTVLDDGRILLGGQARFMVDTPAFFAMRLRADGTPDPTYGQSQNPFNAGVGLAWEGVPLLNALATTFAGDRVIVAGSADDAFAVARFTGDRLFSDGLEASQ